MDLISREAEIEERKEESAQNVPKEDLISRKAAIEALKGLPTWWADEGGYYGGAQPPMVALLDPEDAVSAIENLPAAEPEKRTEERTETHACDSISRQAAIRWVKTECNPYGKPTLDFESGKKVIEHLERMPSAQPERLTDDDFETIRIHLNAYKEKLCNQQRWEEADEYQRIIDRFMAFASAQPKIEERKEESAQNVLKDDSVSRKAAIDAVNRVIADYIPTLYGRYEALPLEMAMAIKRLPTAQPEIIYCKKCEHWTRTYGDEQWGLGDCDVFDKHLVRCNGYCAWAERRTDEAD